MCSLCECAHMGTCLQPHYAAASADSTIFRASFIFTAWCQPIRDHVVNMMMLQHHAERKGGKVVMQKHREGTFKMHWKCILLSPMCFEWVTLTWSYRLSKEILDTISETLWDSIEEFTWSIWRKEPWFENALSSIKYTSSATYRFLLFIATLLNYMVNQIWLCDDILRAN